MSRNKYTQKSIIKIIAPSLILGVSLSLNSPATNVLANEISKKTIVKTSAINEVNSIVQSTDLGSQKWLIDEVNKELFPKKVGSNVTFGDLQKITSIYTKGISGSIPKEISNITNLEELYIDDSRELTGSIPSEIGSLKKLKVLDLYSTNVGGEIPKEIADISTLIRLGLSFSEFNGSIPLELGDMPNLKQLVLINNKLTGSIPSELSYIPDLNQLALNGNKLTGSIPEKLSQALSLKQLSLEDNELTGSIPNSLNRLQDIQYLNLSKNKFVGIIPEFIYNLPNLSEFYVNDTQLTLNSKEQPLVDEENRYTTDYTNSFVTEGGFELAGNQEVRLDSGTTEFKPFDSSSPGYLNLNDGKGNELYSGHTYTIKNIKTDEILYKGSYDPNVSISINQKTNMFELVMDDAPLNKNNIFSFRIYS